MKNLSPTLQRLVLAFTTGLFLSCAAHVSGQSEGTLSSAIAVP